MRRRLSYLAGFLLLAACSDTPVEYSTSAAPRLGVVGEASNRYVVMLSSGTTAEEFTRAATSLGGTVVALHEGAGFAVVEGLSSARAAKLARQRGVQAVEPDLVAQVLDPVIQSAPEATDVGAASQANPATASIFLRQWNLRAIGAHTAWAAGHLGSQSVKVAILDSGIDTSFPDLTGLVDVTRSASFVATGSTDPLNPSDDQLLLTFFGPGRPAWTDLNGHGTFTATQASSKAVVAAGVTSRVTLMAVKVLNARGGGAFSSILQGVAYATDNDADVINMSLGAVFARHGGYIGFLNNITRYAHARGVTIVVAAGNEAIDLDHSRGVYAAFCSSGMVICVSATGPTLATTGPNNTTQSVNGPFFRPSVDLSAIYTNFGTSSVDVAAPGGNYAVVDGNVVSAVFVWAGCSRTALDFIEPEPPEGSPPGTPPPPPFYRKSVCADPTQVGLPPTALFVTRAVGTSAASPHVAGLAALLVERVGRNPGQIRTIIQQTADDRGKPGADPRYGKGRINVARALGL